MAKMMEVPEGTDKVDVRKRINKMLSTARRNAKPEIYIIIPLTFPILQAFPPVH